MARVKRDPQRICVGCGQTRMKKELIRIVRSPDYQIKIDTTGKMSGRGAYLCRRMECLTTALAGKQLERALRMEMPQEVIADLKKTILGEI
ncbi:MAG: YlxR family protein [Syntrophaceticus sp.]|nr:YlxR family protein [Syntrophomonadaceae bacterium]